MIPRSFSQRSAEALRSEFFIRDLLVSFAWANFLWLPVSKIVGSPIYTYYFPDREAFRQHIFDLILGICIVGLLITILVTAARRRVRFTGQAAQTAELGCLFIGLWTLASSVNQATIDRFDAPFLTAASVCCMVVRLSWFRFSFFRTLLRNVAVIMLFLQSWVIWSDWQRTRLMDYGGPIANRAGLLYEASGLTDAPRSYDGKRVVWIIFDELDEKLSMEDSIRPLPNFQRLKSMSIQATAAVPDDPMTKAAIPAMLTGVPFHGDEALARTTQREYNHGFFKGQPSLFAHLRHRGVPSAILGWFHPYCSLIGSDTGRCFSALWTPGSVESYLQRKSWMDRLLQNGKTVLKSIPLVRGFYLRSRISSGEFHRPAVSGLSRRLFDMQRAEIASFLRLQYGLVIIHLAVPHPPGISTNIKDGVGGDYLDNLAVADQTLGEILQAMQDSDSWAQTALLVTGDHQLRVRMWGDQLSNRVLKITGGVEDPRTVFLLKLPGQESGAVYQQPFSLVLVHDLILSVQSGSLSQAGQVLKWLDRERGRFPATPLYSLAD